jgi:hypothetical protein
MFTSIFQWYFGGNHLMMRRRWWHSGFRVEEKTVFGEQVQWFNYFIGSSQIKVPKRDPDQTSWFATWKLPEYGVIYCVSGPKIAFAASWFDNFFFYSTHIFAWKSHMTLARDSLLDIPISLYQIPGLCCLSHLNSWFLWLRHASTPHVCCSRLFRYS